MLEHPKIPDPVCSFFVSREPTSCRGAGIGSGRTDDASKGSATRPKKPMGAMGDAAEASKLEACWGNKHGDVRVRRDSSSVVSFSVVRTYVQASVSVPMDLLVCAGAYFCFFSAGFRIWKEQRRLSSTLIMAPALSNSPQ